MPHHHIETTEKYNTFLYSFLKFEKKNLHEKYTCRYFPFRACIHAPCFVDPCARRDEPG